MSSNGEFAALRVDGGNGGWGRRSGRLRGGGLAPQRLGPRHSTPVMPQTPGDGKKVHLGPIGASISALSRWMQGCIGIGAGRNLMGSNGVRGVGGAQGALNGRLACRPTAKHRFLPDGVGVQVQRSYRLGLNGTSRLCAVRFDVK